MKNIFWAGYCNKERVVAISEIEKIINTNGYITDFKQYSDISIMLKIEIEELNIDNLHKLLIKYMVLDKIESLNFQSTKERVIFLNITFTTGTGDLRIDVPAIPG